MKKLLGFCIFLLSLYTYADGPTVVVGTLKYNPPYGIQSGNEFFGFEIELMREICKRIGSTCQFKGVEFKDLPELLANNNITLAIGAIIITPERSKKFLFSIPYKESFLQFVVKKNSSYATPDKLKNKTIAAYSNSPAIEFVKNKFDNQIVVKTYPDSLDMLNALNQDKVQALITNSSQANYWISNNETFKLLGKKFNIGQGYGIMTTFQNKNLITKINQALIDIENDGTYLKIYERSF